jgi:hypothetical protein
MSWVCFNVTHDSRRGVDVCQATWLAPCRLLIDNFVSKRLPLRDMHPKQTRTDAPTERLHLLLL